jgi:hypothetical protein
LAARPRQTAHPSPQSITRRRPAKDGT